MKNIFILWGSILLLTSCVSTPPLLKGEVYKGMYKENTQTVLTLLPINKTNDVDAKEFFYGTLNMPIVDMGYYVMPSFLTAEILRRESAGNSEVFLDQSLTKFGEVFGVDAILFTIITNWKKNILTSIVEVEVEYILKSTRTNQILFHRKGDIKYSTKVKTNNYSIAGLITSAVLSVANTAATDFVKVGRMCNHYTLSDIPAGSYSPNAKIDSTSAAGKKEFSVKLSN